MPPYNWVEFWSFGCYESEFDIANKYSSSLKMTHVSRNM